MSISGSAALSNSSIFPKRGEGRRYQSNSKLPLTLPYGPKKPYTHHFPSSKSQLQLSSKVKQRSLIVSVAADSTQAMEATEPDTENLAIFSIDPALDSYKDHFRYRMKRYVDQAKLIADYEGGLEQFAQGYLKFGFNKEDGSIVYREWAPAAQEAQLIGDFNNCDGSNHRMVKNEFGVWSIRIPDSGGKPAIPHNSRVKFRFKHGNGVWVDRIPAWIKYATVDPSRFAAPYDSVYWDPPHEESYQLKTPTPSETKSSLNIRGTCWNEQLRTSYKLLPRIRRRSIASY